MFAVLAAFTQLDEFYRPVYVAIVLANVKNCKTRCVGLSFDVI